MVPHAVTLETGELARQADGAVLASMGQTVVLVTACAQKTAIPGRDFFPLTVNYIEKTYAAGRIPGGFFKREGRPTERETLTSRLIDRPIRPLFPDGFNNEVQVVATVMSLDPGHRCGYPGAAGCVCGADDRGPAVQRTRSARRVWATATASICSTRRAPSRRSPQLDLVVAGTQPAVLMVESEAQMLSEEVMLGAVVFGHEQMQIAIRNIRELAAEAGKPRWDWKPPAFEAPLAEAVAARDRGRLVRGLSHHREDAAHRPTG